MKARFSAACRLLPAAFCFLASGFWILPPARADKKLTEDDRIEILRGLLSEYATVKAALPRSKDPLPFDSNGTWDKQKWNEANQKNGPAARVGDLVQITKLTIEGDKIVFEINGGMKGKGSWKDHISLGMGGTTSPISSGQNSNAPGGTNIALRFNQPIPPLKAADIKKMLAPVLDFEKETATENYVEKLPEPIQNAIKANKAIEGMDREMVVMALGKPRHKERNTDKDGTEIEDWIYGDPPGKITFVTFANSKVIRIKEAYADIGGSTAPSLPVK
jgi:sulfur carrier protein ThiS